MSGRSPMSKGRASPGESLLTVSGTCKQLAFLRRFRELAQLRPSEIRAISEADAGGAESRLIRRRKRGAGNVIRF